MEARQIVKRTPYEEYLAMPEDVRCELINNRIVMMGAASFEHQRVCGEIFGQLWQYLRDKRCQVAQDVGVRFQEYEPINNALRPDLTVICDPSKIRPEGIVGAPDLVIEILSPSTVRTDKLRKFDLYKREGVREYWIVEPVHQVVHVYSLEDGLCPSRPYGSPDRILVGVLEECEIDLSLVFPESETGVSPATIE